MTKETRLYNGEKTVSPIVVLGKLNSYMQKNEISTFFNIIHKNKLKMDQEVSKARYYNTL